MLSESLSIAERSLKPGDVLGDYEILEHLATGGMAEIHLARSYAPGDDFYVVIKRLLPHHVGRSEWVSMFIDEATLGARIDHTGISRVSRLVDCEGVLFMVMQYVDGKDMLSVLKRLGRRPQPFPARFAMRLVAEAARALHHVHQMRDSHDRPLGIVHRDISMSNVMVGFDGTATLIDFGIAKGAERITETDVGVRKGKARYMSPEQVRGRPLDGRSDVFSLGVVLYEVTTGRPLFHGSDHIDCMRRVLEQAIPRPKTSCGGYPLGLEAIVRRALARDADQRYGSANELADALDRLADETEMACSTAEISTMMHALYPRHRRQRRRIPTQPQYQFGALLERHRLASSGDWCPDTAEVSAFLDGALDGVQMCG